MYGCTACATCRTAQFVQLLPGVLVLGIALVACIRRPNIATLLLGTVVMGVPVLIFLAGFAGHPLWFERTVFWPLPLGLTLVAIQIVHLRPALARLAFLVVLAIGLVNLGLLHAGRQKDPYREALALIEGARQPRDALLLVANSAVMGATYYQAQLSIAIDGYVIDPLRKRRSMGMPYDALALRPPLVRQPTFLGPDELERIADRYDRVWVLYRSRRSLRSSRTWSVAGCRHWGAEISVVELPPFLELALVDLRAPPAEGVVARPTPRQTLP